MRRERAPARFVFFTDRDLGSTFPDSLRLAGIAVERHDDHFGPTTRDDEWLASVGRRGWVAVTRDRRIRYKPNELAAVNHHRVGLLVVVGKASHAELARGFTAAMPEILRYLTKHSPPFIARVRCHSSMPRRTRRVSAWFP